MRTETSSISYTALPPVLRSASDEKNRQLIMIELKLILPTLILLGSWIDYTLGQQFSKYGHGISKTVSEVYKVKIIFMMKRITCHLPFSLSFPCQCTVVFQRLHNDVICLKANGICASVFLSFKISNMKTSISGKME